MLKQRLLSVIGLAPLKFSGFSSVSSESSPGRTYLNMLYPSRISVPKFSKTTVTNRSPILSLDVYSWISLAVVDHVGLQPPQGNLTVSA
ncbi:hypothetical protein AVEN_207242-1 [Araneus ventricosus]|uniref:Uncharacterized protein n=1 Tax=Araneus ventricosus TaxID=182803 RepID=A0A4Y2PHB2_ARAVE|nr:hypothetical protein AVEN_207242-1 [Araneus ventricosus]